MEPPDPASGFRYWAFISYSSRNTQLAKRLHKELEHYSIPKDMVGKPGRDGPIPPRLFPCFRDRDELPLASNLGTTLQDALRSSRYLIVICTPPAAQSMWVNNEILFFKSLGRADRILALIADGEPNSTDKGQPELECFPPALRYEVDTNGQLTDRRAEPIGGDIRPQGDGWRISVLKAIAGITGLGLNSFIHRERKKSWHNRAILLGILVALLGILFYEWDYNRDKVSYYQNVERVWGFPVGRGEISSETAHHRQISYRIESRQGRVRTISIVNGSGAPVDSDIIYNACLGDVHYRENGDLDFISFINHNNNEVFQEAFSDLRDAGDGTKQQTIEYKAKDVSNNLNQNFRLLGYVASDRLDHKIIHKSDITGEKVEYDSNGKRTKIHFIDAAGIPRPNGDDVYGQSFEYNDLGEVTRVTNLNESDTPTPDESGLVCEENSFDSNGRRISEKYFNIQHQPVLDRFGAAQVDFKYDQYGNQIERDFFGVDGQPRLNRDHFSKITIHYDDRGNRDIETFYGLSGETIPTFEGLARKRYKFDNAGNEIELSVFGTSGNPILGPENCFRITKAYDSRENLIEARFFGIDGKPILNRLGYFRVTWKYNEQGLQIERAWFGLDDKPVVNQDIADNGAARVVLKYDNEGNVTETEYYGTDGQPMINTHQFFKKVSFYGPRGNLVEMRFLGLNGELVLITGGFAVVKMKYDERGNEIQEDYFGLDRNPIQCMDGYYRMCMKYNIRGNLTERGFFDTNNNPVACKQGYASMRWEKDASGKMVPQRYDALGNLISTPAR